MGWWLCVLAVRFVRETPDPRTSWHLIPCRDSQTVTCSHYSMRTLPHTQLTPKPKYPNTHHRTSTSTNTNTIPFLFLTFVFTKVPLLSNLQPSHPCFIRYFSVSLTISSTPFPTLTIPTPPPKLKIKNKK